MLKIARISCVCDDIFLYSQLDFTWNTILAVRPSISASIGQGKAGAALFGHP